MIPVSNVEGIRAAEAECIAHGTDVFELRLRAAKAAAKAIERLLPSGGTAAVFCGPGGNGGDGVIIAAELCRAGKRAAAYLVGGDGARLKREKSYAEECGAEVLSSSAFDGRADVIADAIFGIGLKRNVEGETAALIDRLNGMDAVKLAVDIPSGLDADTGAVLGTAFRADKTVTFSCYKYGMLFGDGPNLCGDVEVADIGVRIESDVGVCDDSDIKPFRRKRTAHKGDYGSIYIVGGCGTMIGAPILAASAAHAAYLNGAGRVTVCVPNVYRTALASRCTMAMMKFMPDSLDGFIKFDKAALDDIMGNATAIAIGMGMGKAPDLREILEYICKGFGGVLIIDADALNAIARDYGFLRDAKPSVVLTPHVGEFKRLTGGAATIENAAALARDINCVVALKSSTTIVTDGRTVRLNVTGTPAMAKGGTGDVLGGCISALSCVYPPFDAATIACYRNGRGAERAVSAFSQMMLTPHDILDYAYFKEL